MKIVLRIIGVIFSIMGALILAGGRSVATDALGIIILLVMGGPPLALGVFLIWKSIGPSRKNVEPVAPDVPEAPPADNEEPVVAADSNDSPQPSAPPMPEPEKPLRKRYTFKVAGISRRQREIINKLLSENGDYALSKKELVEIGSVDERIYKYNPIVAAAELVPEPTNPRDPNAIKVLVGGVHIGYVPADKTGKVKNLSEQKQIHSVSSSFYGGPYMIIHEDFDYDKDKEIYTVERESQYNIGAEVTIEYN